MPLVLAERQLPQRGEHVQVACDRILRQYFEGKELQTLARLHVDRSRSEQPLPGALVRRAFSSLARSRE